MSTGLLTLLCAGLGLLLGSFLKVVIYRIPRTLLDDHSTALTLWWPPSHCPACQHRLSPYENIPLLSFVLQRGRCRHCCTRIAWRYPVVELLTAVLFAAQAAYCGWGLPLLAVLLLTSWLLPLLWIDLETLLLPDALTLSLLWLGLLFNLITGLIPVPAAVWGAAGGYAVLWGLAHAYRLLRGQEGMGLGDAKLLAALGAWLGWQALPQVVLLACALTIAGVALRRALWKIPLRQAAPFGPGLAVAGLLLALALFT